MSGEGSGGRKGVRSLDVVEEIVRREREAQLRHWDALDAKAGVMLGFAGALAALAPADLNALVDGGRITAVVGALVALWAFWPREELAVTLDRKASRVKWSMSFLAGGAVLVAVGVLVD